jgi:hypothetical protein
MGTLYPKKALNNSQKAKVIWRARRDLNPGSPAPQASVLIQPRLRAPSTRLLYSNNINADVKGKIINRLFKLKNNGLARANTRAKNTIRSTEPFFTQKGTASYIHRSLR